MNTHDGHVGIVQFAIRYILPSYFSPSRSTGVSRYLEIIWPYELRLSSLQPQKKVEEVSTPSRVADKQLVAMNSGARLGRLSPKDEHPDTQHAKALSCIYFSLPVHVAI